MYFDYMINWLYRVMQVPVPLVVSQNIYGLVTVFDLFLFTVYLGLFVVLLKYMITDTLSLNVGGVDINYSSDAYIARHYRDSVENHIKNSNRKKEATTKRNELLKKQRKNMYAHINDGYKQPTYNNSIGGRILARKNAGRISTNKSNSIGGRILAKKGK